MKQNKNAVYIKALSHDICTIFSTLRETRSRPPIDWQYRYYREHNYSEAWIYSEARELRVELGGHRGFHALTGRDHNVLRKRPCE